jgi:hypothetical protein
MTGQRASRKLSDDEMYRLFATYGMDVARALSNVWLLRAQNDDSIRRVLLRDAIVAYARPFSQNRTLSGATHSLTPKVVPRQFARLHRRLLEIRNQLLAHSDLGAVRPVVRQVHMKDIHMITFSEPEYDELSEPALLEGLFESVHDAILTLGRTVRPIPDGHVPITEGA